MSFFESDIVQDEFKNLVELKKLRDLMMSDSCTNLTLREAADRIELLQESLDKLKLFYVRLSLSNDREAIALKNKLNSLAMTLGKTNIMEVFEDLQQTIDIRNDYP
jgi:hypothetical protein